jgi:hypothetical protein
MVKSHAFYIFLALTAVTLLAGCGAHPETKTVGSIDLSKKGNICSFDFTWNFHNPCIEFILSDTNGSARFHETNPTWSLEIQVQVFDKKTGVSLVTSDVTSTNMYFTNWELPKTSIELMTSEFYNVLHDGTSYKYVVTVLREEKSVGTVDIKMKWVVGGDSM